MDRIEFRQRPPFTHLCDQEITIHLVGPAVWIATSKMTHERAVRLLLEEATGKGQEPKNRFADGTPAIHMTIAKPGGLFDRETMVVVMPTEYIVED